MDHCMKQTGKVKDSRMPLSCYHAILQHHKISTRSFLSLDKTAETKLRLNCKIFVGRKIPLHLESTSCLQLTAGRSLLLILSCSAGMCCLFKEFQFQSISIKGSSPINHANVSVSLQIKGQISQFTGSRCGLKLQNLSFFFFHKPASPMLMCAGELASYGSQR